MHKKLVRSLWALVAALALGFTSQALAAEKLSLGTSHPGGATFEIGTAIAKVITDNSDGKLEVSASITGGSSANVRALQKKDSRQATRMAMATAPAIYWGQNAIAPFKKKEDVLALVSLYPLSTAYVTFKNSGIKNWHDLVGKRFVVGARGGSIYIVTQNALRYAGIYDKVNKQFFSNPQNAAAIKDQRVDAGYFMINGHQASPAYMDLARTMEGKLRWFGPDEKTLKIMTEKEAGVVRSVIPAGSVPGQDKDIVTWGQTWAIMSNSHLPNDTAYLVVKTLMEHHSEVQKYHPLGKFITQKSGLDGMSKLKMHPGAIRYWKEVGMMK